ncbi:MAG: hypothetical protein GF405_02820 [Candidatus Eisenbacteria bacterium]|nr:hypothetical protein [Candidatus Eisenbacteria bacterium]
MMVRRLIIPVVLLATFALAAAPAQAQDGEGENGEGPTGFQGTNDTASQAGFSPKYDLSYNKDQDISSWRHDFSLSYQLSPKMSFRATTNITTRENEVLDRNNRQENWNATLGVNVSSAISTGLKYHRVKQVDIRNEGTDEESKTFRNRENVSLSTSYKKAFLSGLSASLGTSAGIERNEYSNIESRGSNQSVNAALTYRRGDHLTTEIGYSGSHSLLDSEQGALESQDESFNNAIRASFDYTMENHSVRVNMARTAGVKEYPKDEQTERREQDSESANVQTTLGLVEGLTTQIGFNYSRSKATYDIETTKDSEITSRGVDASLSYTLGETNMSATLRSEKKRNEYYDFRTGDQQSGSFGATISHSFGEKLEASVQWRVGLTAHMFDDTRNNDQDRDIYDQESSLNLEYKPRRDLSAGLSVRIREDQLIYIRTSRSGDTKTSETYAVSPWIRKIFSPRFSVKQTYTLSADYTFYRYEEDSNFLIRNFGVQTTANWKVLDPVSLSISHEYRGQDEGSYREDDQGVERYGKNSERDNHRMSLTLKYRIFDVIDFEASHDYSVQTRWTFSDGEREFAWERFDTSASVKANATHEFEDGTKVRLSVGRKHRDATNIVERQKEVWDISLNIVRTF